MHGTKDQVASSDLDGLSKLIRNFTGRARAGGRLGRGGGSQTALRGLGDLDLSLAEAETGAEGTSAGGASRFWGSLSGRAPRAVRYALR